MKLSEMLKTYGDIEVLAVIPSQDRMLSPSEIKAITGKEPYAIIRRLKAKHKLGYTEKIISESILREEYGLKKG